MSSYSIHHFSSITGINKILLRTWENRYSFLVSHRSTTNIRYYDDEMIVKALNIKTLIQNGVKVSKIDKLSDNEITTTVDKMYKTKTLDDSIEYYITKLIDATLNFNDELCEKTFEAGIKEHDLIPFYRKVLLPTLSKIGALWLTRSLSPSQEHFLSEKIKIKISSTIASVKSAPTRETWLLFLPENELHDIGLQISHLILKHEGCKVVYLGPNLPIKSLVDVKDKIKINNILYFNLSNQSLENCRSRVNNLMEIFPNATQYLVTHKALFEGIDKHPNLKILTEVDDLIKAVK